MRLLLSLTDNWQPTGGADQFTRWAGLSSHEAFYSDTTAKQYYKDHIRTLLTRYGRGTALDSGGDRPLLGPDAHAAAVESLILTPK